MTLRLFRNSLLACLASLCVISGVEAKPSAATVGQPAGGQPSQVQQTRLGALELENGYPSKATAAKLYDEIDFQRATQAYLWALPAVGFKALYDAQAQTFGARNGDVVLYQTLEDKAGMSPSRHCGPPAPSTGSRPPRARAGSPTSASTDRARPTSARPGS